MFYHIIVTLPNEFRPNKVTHYTDFAKAFFTFKMYVWVCIFIDAHKKKSMAMRASNVSKLANAEQHSGHTSYVEFSLISDNPLMT